MVYRPSRLAIEIAILVRCEQRHGLRAAPVITQLVADSERPLPDFIPGPPTWTTFQWPRSGAVDYEREWRRLDAIKQTGYNQ